MLCLCFCNALKRRAYTDVICYFNAENSLRIFIWGSHFTFNDWIEFPCFFFCYKISVSTVSFSSIKYCVFFMKIIHLQPSNLLLFNRIRIWFQEIVDFLSFSIPIISVSSLLNRRKLIESQTTKSAEALTFFWSTSVGNSCFEKIQIYCGPLFLLNLIIAFFSQKQAFSFRLSRQL